MPLDMFEKIVVKAKKDGAYRVDIFSWIEPFLCQNLEEYTQIIKKHGLPCGVSTTLALRNIRSFAAVLRDIDLLTISISGFDQETNAINHKGANIEWVKKNLATLSHLLRSGHTKVNATLRMLLFDYNAHHEPLLRQYASNLGINFEVLRAAGHPRHAQQSPREREDLLRRLATPYDDNGPHQPGKVCPLLFEHVTINAHGDVYQCTAYGNFDIMRIGHFLNLSREEILFRRYTQPVCRTCNWARRWATRDERRLVHQALNSQLGEAIPDRVPSLSGPLDHVPTTQDGHIVEKHLAFAQRRSGE